MIKACYLATLYTVVLSEALRALLDQMGLWPASPSKWEASWRSWTLKLEIIKGLPLKADGGALAKDSLLLEAQPSPLRDAETFDGNISLNSRGIFNRYMKYWSTEAWTIGSNQSWPLDELHNPTICISNMLSINCLCNVFSMNTYILMPIYKSFVVTLIM